MLEHSLDVGPLQQQNVLSPDFIRLSYFLETVAERHFEGSYWAGNLPLKEESALVAFEVEPGMVEDLGYSVVAQPLPGRPLKQPIDEIRSLLRYLSGKVSWNFGLSPKHLFANRFSVPPYVGSFADKQLIGNHSHSIEISTK